MPTITVKQNAATEERKRMSAVWQLQDCSSLADIVSETLEYVIHQRGRGASFPGEWLYMTENIWLAFLWGSSLNTVNSGSVGGDKGGDSLTTKDAIHLV